MSSKSSRKPIVVLGVGNILLRDEGIGVRVVERMQETGGREDVELVDGGTGGADLVDVLADREKVIVVDAIESDCQAGTISRLGIDDLVGAGKNIMSLHDVGVVEALQMTKVLGCAPEDVVVVGIKPETVESGLELSETLQAAVPQIVEFILAELK